MTTAIVNKPFTCKELRELRWEHQHIKKSIYAVEKVALAALLTVVASYIPLGAEITFVAGSILSPYSSLMGGGMYLIGEATVHMFHHPTNMHELCRFMLWETIGMQCIKMAAQIYWPGLLEPTMQSTASSYADYFIDKKLQKFEKDHTKEV